MHEMKEFELATKDELPANWKYIRNKALFFEVNNRCDAQNDYELLSVSEYYGVAPKAEKINDKEVLVRADSLDGYKICHRDDIVMNIMLAWKRAQGVSNYVGIVSPAYCIYRKKDDANIDMHYFHYLIRTDEYASLYKRFSTGIIDSRLRLYPDKFLSLYSHVPPIDVQIQIGKLLDKKSAKVDALIANQEAQIEKLKAYKQSLITEVVTKGLDPNVPMKDSGVEWIGEVPKHWNVMKMRYVVDEIGDIDHYMPDTKKEGFPYVMTGDLKPKLSEIDFDNCKKVSEEEYKKLSNKIKTEVGDLIFARYATIGTICVVDIEKEFLVSYSCVTIKPSKCTLLGEYLFYYILSSCFAEEATKYTNSNTQGNIGIAALYQTKVIVPTIDEQKQIIDYLKCKCSQIDRLISIKQKKIEKLNQYKKSLIYEYVTGKKEVL